MKPTCRSSVRSLAVGGALLLAGVALPAVAEDRLDLGFATSSSGGTGYMYAVAVATVVNANEPGIKITAFPSAGVIENDRLLRNGEAQLILHTGGQAYSSYMGEGKYPSAYKELRALWPIYASLIQIVVPADSDAKRPGDLSDKRVGLGAPGSSANKHVRQVLEIEGLPDGKFRAQPNSLPEQVTALKDGKLDALSIIMGASAPALMDLATSRQVRWLPLSEDTVAKLEAMNPPGAIVPVTIAANAYQGQAEPVPTVGLPIWVMTDAKLSGEAAERIVGTFFDRLKEAAEVHPVVNETTKDFLQGAKPPVPWHEGARKALEARGYNLNAAQ